MLEVIDEKKMNGETSPRATGINFILIEVFFIIYSYDGAGEAWID